MRNAYLKDQLRNIKNNGKRFVALLAITALGITVFTGIYAACRDMFLAADRFYDQQRLFDVRVLSTLGLTDEDVAALQNIGGVELADGVYSEKVHTEVGEIRQTAEMTVLSEKGLNAPYLLEGELPRQAGEIAVTQKYMDASGKGIGDALVIEEELDEDEDGDGSGENDAAVDEGGVEDAAGGGESGGVAGGDGGNGVDAGENEGGEDGDGGTDTDVDWDAEVEIDDAEKPTFPTTTYVITGVVTDPADIANSDESMAFRATATTDYTFFITAADADTDIYTSIYLTIGGLAEMNCYSAEYEDAVDAVVGMIESQIMKQREKARYEAVLAEAMETIGDAEATMNEKFDEADEKFADAWLEIEDAKKEILDGEAELTREERDALQKLADARAELEDAEAKLASGEAELNTGQAELNRQAEVLAAGKEELAANREAALAQFAAAEATLAQKEAEVGAALGAASAGAEQMKAALGDAWPAGDFDALVGAAAGAAAGQMAGSAEGTVDPAAVAGATGAEQDALAAALAAIGQDGLAAGAIEAGLGLGIAQGGQQALSAGRTAFEEQKAAALAQMDSAAAEIAAGEVLIAEGQKKIDDGWAELNAGRAELASGKAELDKEEAKALRELADAWQELADGKEELAEGEAELVENEEKYQDQRAEAEQKLADAYAELADIDMAQWYVQDRGALDSYSSLDSDLTSIDVIGKAFPILFLIVAVLISLTTMTRMVEEERGLIGTYKALGFGSFAICRKYLTYAVAASVLGSVLGFAVGFYLLPRFLIGILEELYIIPGIVLQVDFTYGAFGSALFIVSIVGATALACQSELRKTPASLMRPKAPRAGSRIILEYIPAIWNRMKFLNKVTARNLFRYKKRLFMTVIGIAGCTALVLAGFAIRDSVTSMMPKQYENLHRYDLMVVADEEDNGALLELVGGDGRVADFVNVQVESVKVLNMSGASESLSMVVIPDGVDFSNYVFTPNLDGEAMAANGNGVLVTRNATGLLGLEEGDAMLLQNLVLDQHEVVLGGVVENYLGNYAFISQGLYEDLFGEFAPNAVYAHFAEGVDDPIGFAEGLLDHDFVLSSLSRQALMDDFESNFAIINSVIYLFIVLAAGLAFVVLFTLAGTNISERARELATIKVLGFFDREVHAYVNKETLILTVIGVLCGLPLGYGVSWLLMLALKMPSIHFALEIYWYSYLIAAVISFSFAVLVNLITNRTLDRIDMVEALKSVE